MILAATLSVVVVTDCGTHTRSVGGQHRRLLDAKHADEHSLRQGEGERAHAYDESASATGTHPVLQTRWMKVRADVLRDKPWRKVCRRRHARRNRSRISTALHLRVCPVLDAEAAENHSRVRCPQTWRREQGDTAIAFVRALLIDGPMGSQHTWNV